MQLQITTDYAIRIIGYLHQHNNQLSTAMDMSIQLGISYQYFMKVVNRLKRANLVHSIQGCNGGYQLSCKASEITLYDLICVMEGDIRINRCLEEDRFCSRRAVNSCPVHKLFQEVQEELVEIFKSKKMSDIWD